MASTARRKAEIRLAAIRVNDGAGLSELEQEKLEKAERSAKLRALRLSKEAADREAAGEEEKMKQQGQKKPARPKGLPQAHRRTF